MLVPLLLNVSPGGILWQGVSLNETSISFPSHFHIPFPDSLTRKLLQPSPLWAPILSILPPKQLDLRRLRGAASSALSLFFRRADLSEESQGPRPRALPSLWAGLTSPVQGGTSGRGLRAASASSFCSLSTCGGTTSSSKGILSSKWSSKFFTKGKQRERKKSHRLAECHKAPWPQTVTPFWPYLEIHQIGIGHGTVHGVSAGLPWELQHQKEEEAHGDGGEGAHAGVVSQGVVCCSLPLLSPLRFPTTGLRPSASPSCPAPPLFIAPRLSKRTRGMGPSPFCHLQR